MITVLSVLGTRPEAIKMAPVIRRMRSRPGIRPIVCWTGQHRDIVGSVLELFEIVPEFELRVMRDDQTLAGVTARLLEALDPLLASEGPDWVLAQGDTTSVLAASLASFYRGIRFGHVEAGLRTGDLQRPFPEELNRIVADRIAAAHFAPTERSRRALLAEGIDAQRIHVTGNTGIDALLHVADLPLDRAAGPLASVPTNGRIVVVTAHRRESFGEPFDEVCGALAEIARRFEAAGVHLVYPVHPNPNVRGPVERHLTGISNVTLLPPLDYASFVHLLKSATLVLTDSGGIQEEVPALRVPVLVLRDETERPEGVELGVARLVGTSRERIVDEASRLLCDEASRAAMATGASPYGDGRAAERIVSFLEEAA